MCKENKFVSWNDGGGKSCVGKEGYAHDKGIIAYNDNSGIYCQHSNPFWGFFKKGFLESGTAKHAGIQTNLAQHFLFIKLPDKTSINNMVTLMNNSNVCHLDGAIDGFEPCIKSDDSDCESYITKKINGLSIISKPKGVIGDDVWSNMDKMNYKESGMHVWSFCSPPCQLGRGKSKDSINNIIDVNNNPYNIKSLLNNDSCDVKFDEFKSNHAKIVVCYQNDAVIIG